MFNTKKNTDHGRNVSLEHSIAITSLTLTRVSYVISGVDQLVWCLAISYINIETGIQ